MSSSSISPNSLNPNPNPNPNLKTLENQNPEISNQPTNPDEKGEHQSTDDEAAEQIDGDKDKDKDEEEEGECGFCLFMKAGGCKDAFVAWELCVEEGEKNNQDIVEKCFEVTSNLKKCMEAHSEYYDPILQAEKAADDEIKQELERHATNNNNVEESKGIDQTVVEKIEVEKQQN